MGIKWVYFGYLSGIFRVYETTLGIKRTGGMVFYTLVIGYIYPAHRDIYPVDRVYIPGKGIYTLFRMYLYPLYTRFVPECAMFVPDHAGYKYP